MARKLSVWPPLSLAALLRQPARPLPFPLEDTRCRLFSRARHALWHGVQALGLRVDDEVLAPAYHAGAEIEALERAGLLFRFYDLGETLEPDADELEALLSREVRALYLIHYLGFPQDAGRWRRWCEERGLLLLEDATQAWLASSQGLPVGSFGHLSIFSPKSLGLHEGAALVCQDGTSAGVTAGAATSADGWATAAVAAVPGGLRQKVSGGEDGFDLGDPASLPARGIEALLARLADPTAAPRRRANYELLLVQLPELVATPFSRLPAGAVPLAFPLAVERKRDELDRLRQLGVAALDLWPRPHAALPAGQHPVAASLREHLVALPVHQELTPQELERVAAAARGRLPLRSRVRLEALTSFESVRKEWTELAEATGNIFATWEWNSIWWKYFGDGRRLLVTGCRDDADRLVAILPLYVSRERPLRTIRFIGHGQGDHLSPICRTSDRGATALAFREALRGEAFDIFLGDKVPANAGWATLLGARALRRTGSPVLRFAGGSWDELLATRSANFREQVRRRERKLAREHELSFRLCDDPKRLQQDLDVLFRLHVARWGGEGGWFSGATEGFHREFAACALERGWLRLWLLELDGKTAAAWYGFRFRDAESYYQAGRDPAWERMSVGFVLLTHSIREALADGMSEYRFLEGGESYKYRFANADPGLETIALSRGGLGGAAVTAAAALGGREAFAALGRRLAG